MPHLISYPIPDDLADVRLIYRMTEASGAEPESYFPTGRPFFAVNLDGGWVVDSAARDSPFELPEAYTVGQTTTHYTMRPMGAPHLFGVLFAPTALYRLYGVPMREATDVALDVHTLDLPPLAALATAIRSASTDAERVAVVVASVRQRLRECEASGAVERAVGLILDSGGTMPIAEVARGAGLTRRTLERGFARSVGIPPKRYSSIVRLVAAIGRLSRGEVPSWSLLAEGLGYYDQAHFSRDFKALTGQTPLAFVCRPTPFTHEIIEQHALPKPSGL